jgi:uncharacterized membrane protein
MSRHFSERTGRSQAGSRRAEKGVAFRFMARLIVRLLLGALFLFTGTVHLVDKRLLLPIMPPWIPFPLGCIVLSGICELLGGLGLLVPHPEIQRAAGIGLALLLVAVFPANIYMAVANIRIHGLPTHPWMAWARLPLQPLLIWAVLWSTKMLRS